MADHPIQDADGRLVGRLKHSHAGWQVEICYHLKSNHSIERPLTDPEIQDNLGYYPLLSDAKKALARHIAGLCLIQGYLDKHDLK